MGRGGDTLAVIASRSPLYGVEKLRVVHVFGFPFLQPAHSMNTVFLPSRLHVQVMRRRGRIIEHVGLSVHSIGCLEQSSIFQSI